MECKGFLIGPCFVVWFFLHFKVLRFDEKERPYPEVIKLFSCSTQLSTKFQLLIQTKILTNKEVSCFKALRICIYHANKNSEYGQDILQLQSVDNPMAS